jgi:hypothetical protein
MWFENAGEHARKLLAALFGAAFSFLAWVPEYAHKAALVALGFFIVDSITGTYAAARRGALSSQAMGERTRAKLVQFGGIMAICTGFAVLSGSWAWVVTGWGGIIGREALSIVENVLCLQSRGTDLGTFGAMLQRAATHFARIPQALFIGEERPKGEEIPSSGEEERP